MSVLYKLYRYRFPLLLFGLCLAVILLLRDSSVSSQLVTASKPVNPQYEFVSSKTINNSVKDLVKGNVHKTVLENGLKVITKEVHTAPVVTVQLWYKVGSRNEEPGVNGITHQLEHMMFKGTASRPIQFGQLFSALGSDSNAFTSYDQTAYYGTVERDKLKALLELEADRMQNALIESEQLVSEKRVVISELQGYENDPEYRLNRAVMRAAFPDHPYGLPVGGTKTEVEKFTVEQVQEYYRNFYRPDNAVLVIVGDFKTEDTIAQIKELFGNLSNTNTSTNNNTNINKSNDSCCVASTELNKTLNKQNSLFTQEKQPIILQEPGAAGILQAVYRLPDIKHPDVPALDVMDYVLSEGRNSRLYQALVDSGIATDISASVASLIESGWYEISVTAPPKQDLKKINSIIAKEITKLVQKGVTTDELKRAKAQFEAAVILGNRDITNLAMQIGNDETITGDYDFMNGYLSNIRRVTSQDIQRVAKQYLAKEAQFLGLFQPTQAPTTSKSSTKANFKQAHEDFISGASADAVDVLKYLPQSEDSGSVSTSRTLPETITLPNGLRVLMLPDKSTPTITLSGYIKAGSEFEPKEKAGLAELVADNLLSGTQTKDVLTIANELEERGAHLAFNALREGVRLEGNSLATDLPILIQTLADVVKNPTFPSKELELSRKQSLTALEQDLDDPSEVARRTFVQSVYPKSHPFHKFPTLESLRRISRRDVVNFKTKHYRPDSTVLAMVGDFDVAKVKALIKAEFEDWQKVGEAPAVEYPKVSMPSGVIRVNSVLPGKAQAITYMGNTAINRQDGRYYSALVLNQILGGDTLSSRLGAEVRDKQGLSYGIFSSFLALRNSGTFLIEMQTNPEDVNKAVASTRKLLEEIHQFGVTQQELENAKRTAISNYIVSLVDPDELTHQILMNEVYGLNSEELRDFIDKVKTVTLADVNQAARELLHPDKIVVATAGPAVVADQGMR